jgi:DNA-binding response OmpR family regulator
LEKKRILVIDDDEVILKIFKEILEMEDYIVDTAKTGKEAIEKSYANLYNMALIDIRLPDMDGTQLLTRMRETVPKMVKIIVTGFVSTNSTIEATRGADGYVTKPIMDTDEFLSKIKEHLKRQDESESQKQS